MYPKPLFWLKRGLDLLEVWAVSLRRSSGLLLGRDMAADYEHDRIVKHTIFVLLMCAWCGLNHIGIDHRAFPHDNEYHITSLFDHEIDTLGLPVREIGCTMQHHNHKKQWQKINCRENAVIDRALVFLAQTKNVDDAKNLQVHPANNSDNLQFACNKNAKPKHCMPADSRLKRDEDEDDDDNNYCGCGTSHSTGQGKEDHAGESLPFLHWIGNKGLWKVWEVCFQVNTFNGPNCSIAVTSHMITSRFDDTIGDKAEKNSIWTLISLFTLMSELVHAIMVQERSQLRHVRSRHKAAISCNLVRAGLWFLVARVFLCLGLVWFACTWGIWCGPVSCPSTLIKKPNKHKRAKFAKPDSCRMEKFKVEVDVFYHGMDKPLHVNRIIGDGNCYWRAVAKQTKYSWYRLKRLTTNYMLQHAQDHHDSELAYEVKQLQKKNAWANMLAILGTVAFLQRDVRICVRQHIIQCSARSLASPAIGGSPKPINLHFDEHHYSGIDAKDVKCRYAAVDQTLGCSLKEFSSIPLDSYCKDKVLYRHRLNCGCKIRRQGKSRSVHSPTSWDTMPPKHRPAGPGPAGRRLNETFSEQIQRLVKAKTGGSSDDRIAKAAPKSDASSTPVPRIPKQPAGPPPGYQSAPRRPPTPPARPSRAPDLVVPVRALPPPTPPPARSRGVASAATAATPAATETPVSPPQELKMKEVLIASGGQRFQWRTPYLSDESIVLLEDLFHVKDNDPSNRLYGHLGVHVQTMQKFALQPLFVASITKQVVAALQHESTVIVYQCTSGRHRSVAAVQLTKDVIKCIDPNVRIHTRHLSSQHWKPSTCGGECDECCIIADCPPAPYKDLVSNIARSALERVGAAYMHSLSSEKVWDFSSLEFVGGSSSSLSCVGGDVEVTFAKPLYAENNTDANENLIEFTNASCIGNLRKNGWDNHDHDLSRDGHAGPMLVHIIPWGFWLGFLCRFLDVCCRLSSHAITKTTKGEAFLIDKCSMSKNSKMSASKWLQTKCKHILPRNDDREQRDASAAATAPVISTIDESSLSFAKITAASINWQAKNTHYDTQNCINQKAHKQLARAGRSECAGHSPLWARVLVAFIVFEIALLGVRFLSGGMLHSYCADCESGEPSDNQHHSTQVVSSLEDQATNILSESHVTVDNIRTLLEHPDVPWQINGDGFQVTLGAARLSLTKATLELPNFTKVFIKYFRQCNNEIYGSTIVINKNLKTELHVDSRNEKITGIPHCNHSL